MLIRASNVDSSRSRLQLGSASSMNLRVIANNLEALIINVMGQYT